MWGWWLGTVVALSVERICSRMRSRYCRRGGVACAPLLGSHGRDGSMCGMDGSHSWP